MRDDYSFMDTIYAQKNEKINGVVLLFFALIVLFFVVAGVWAYFAKVDEIARGAGKVIPSEKLKIVQSLDGGLISDILVKEGQSVTKGQALMKIDTTRFQASLEGNAQTYYHLLITKTRLEAMVDLNLSKPTPKLNFDKTALLKAKEFASDDEKLFHTQIDELKNTLDFYKTKLKEKEAELKELHTRVYQLNKRVKLAKEETTTLSKLVKRGSRSQIDLIKAKKELAQLDGELQGTYASIQRSKFAIQGAKKQIVEKLNTFKTKASENLQKINTEIKKYESKIVSQADMLDKTTLYSPTDGIIKQIHFNTVGGVVKSGMELIEIVPQSDTLLVEAKINPKDIAFINPKQKAIVKITAYDFSIYGGLDGKIVEISADSLIDKEDRQRRSYYRVVIKTDKNYLVRNGEKLPIIPGMITSVDIITGQKSILDFILKPILKTKQNALHER